MKFHLSRLAALLAVSTFVPLAVQAASGLPEGAQSARVIVKFKAESGLLRKQAASVTQRHESQALALGARIGLPLTAGRGVAENTQVVFATGMSSEALAARLGREKDIEYAVPDRRKTRAAAATDPLYADGPAVNQNQQTGGPAAGQWYLRAPTPTVISAINAQAAWDVRAATATPVVVAVIDTGVRFDHPDLKRVSEGGKLLDGYDFVGPDRNDQGVVITPNTFQTAKDGDGRDADASDMGDGIRLAEANDTTGLFYQCTQSDGNGGYVEELSSWHGTQVSGIIGALTDNGIGMASVGRERVRVLPVRALAKCGGWDSDIVAGMNWAAGNTGNTLPANPNPAKVLNLSLGGSGACNALYRDAVAQITALGVTIVASAGNGSGGAVSEPANCPGVIGVGGVRHEGDKVGYSDIGPEVSLSAPAGNCVNTTGTLPCLYPILTTANRGDFDPVAGAGGAIYTDSYNATTGTSFSSPLVAATAALMLSVKPDLTPAEIRSILMSTARTFPVYTDIQNCVAPQAGVKQDQCNCTTSTCGAGMLDANAAVRAAAGGGGGGGGGGSSGGGGGGGALGWGWLAALGVAVLGLRCRRRGPDSA